MLNVRRYTDADEATLLAFHRSMFGPNSYQSTSAYLHWLYRDNSFNDGEPPCFVLCAEDGMIIGCIHTMVLRTASVANDFKIHSLQNLVVDVQHRSGAGMILVKRALKGADVVIFPGVGGSLARAYRAMKYHEISSFWGRKLLRPIGSAFGILANKLGRARHPFELQLEGVALGESTGLKIEALPVMETLETLAIALVERDRRAGSLPVAWDAASLRWRFFSPNGPIHILFMSGSSHEFSIVSVGLRRNVRVARLMENGHGCSLAFMKAVFRALQAIGAEMLLVYTGQDVEKQMFLKLGVSEIPRGPRTFVVEDKRCNLSFTKITTGATDLGFEAFMTKRSAEG
jgi:hypothetical protein